VPPAVALEEVAKTARSLLWLVRGPFASWRVRHGPIQAHDRRLPRSLRSEDRYEGREYNLQRRAVRPQMEVLNGSALNPGGLKIDAYRSDHDARRDGSDKNFIANAKTLRETKFFGPGSPCE
jgi:hypothetical protein